jgi:hypothetical protein
MNANADVRKFHFLFKGKSPRIFYKSEDALDYIFMSVISGAVVYFSYSSIPLIALTGVLGAIYFPIAFYFRHGFSWRLPIILRRPQDLIYCVIYKVMNTSPILVAAVALLAIENYLIYLTPDLPHNTVFMYRAAVGLFLLHLLGLSIYRTVILYHHIKALDRVVDVLSQSVWKRFVTSRKRATMELFHAYITGVFTHIVYLVPWFLLLTHIKYSLLFLPITFLIGFLMQKKFFRVQNSWYYRDHWLGHNSSFDFVYLHGPHHDALPTAMIGVAGNGFLEGFLRSTVGFPITYYNPLLAFLLFTFVVRADIGGHQYIPGLYPRATKGSANTIQHSTHHYGKLEPYGFAMKLDQPGTSEKAKAAMRGFPVEMTNAIELDEQLNGFEWDNATHRWYLGLFDDDEKKTL